MSKERYLCIDILRGLAVSSVLLTHWGGWTAPIEQMPTILDGIVSFLQKIFALVFWAGGGVHPGVIAFIVISGFSIHLQQAVHPDTKYQKGFWISYLYRRFVRIAPLYWFAAILGIASLILAFSYPAFRPGFMANELTLKPLDITLTLTFISNLLPSLKVSNLGNEPLNTVRVLMVLYIMYPIGIVILRRAGWFGVFIVAGILQSFALVLLYLGANPTYVGASFFVFFLYWWLGALSAELFARTKRKGDKQYLVWWSVLAAFLVFLAVSYVIDFKGSHYLKSMLFAIAISCLLYSWMAAESMQKKPSGRISVWLGKVGERSFSLYAIHTPVIGIAMTGFALASIEGLPMRIGSLLAVAIVTLAAYKYIEVPSHRLAGRPRPPLQN